MSEVLYRALQPDLEVRSAAQGGDGRTVFGIVVPWRVPKRVRDGGGPAYSEQWGGSAAGGAFDHQLHAPHRVRFANEHIDLGGKLIGRAIKLRNDAAGLYGEVRVSATPTGDETLELVRDGALDQFSVGFRPRQARRLPGGILERVKADLFEIAVTLQGAYGELATVGGVRSAAGVLVDDVDDLDDRRRLAEAAQIAARLPQLLPIK